MEVYCACSPSLGPTVIGARTFQQGKMLAAPLLPSVTIFSFLTIAGRSRDARGTLEGRC